MFDRIRRKIFPRVAAVIGLSTFLLLSISGIGTIHEVEAADITLSGRITTDINTSVAGATVYIEGPAPAGGTNAWATSTTTDAFGLWTKNVPQGRPYKVQVSKFGSQRDHWPTSISTSKPDINITINPQTTRDLNISVAPDDNFRTKWGALWQSEAWDRVIGKEWIYKQNWNVRFVNTYTDDRWFSPSSTDCLSLLSDAEADTDWDVQVYHGADILLALTAINMASYSGCTALPLPGTGFSHPSAIVEDYADVYNTSVHEIFHLYGFDHHSSQYFCFMQTSGTMVGNYNTAQPSYDQQMAINGANSKRLWY